MWTAAFIALLIVNLAIVATGDLRGVAEDSEFTYDDSDDALLDASDEVRLGWWPAEGDMPGTGVAGERVTQANPVIIERRRVETPGGSLFKDYPRLMAGYIKRVNSYLIKYYHIMSEAAPPMEDSG